MPDFVKERSRAMAVVHLTRRSDLRVAEEMGGNLDLMVTWKLTRKKAYRRFGVRLWGVMEARTAGKANRAVAPILRESWAFATLPFPAVLFCFTMQDDGAWFTWLVEPGEGGGLEKRVEAQCRVLDSKSLDEIVEKVDRWYDSLIDPKSRTLSARPRSRSAT